MHAMWLPIEPWNPSRASSTCESDQRRCIIIMIIARALAGAGHRQRLLQCTVGRRLQVGCFR